MVEELGNAMQTIQRSQMAMNWYYLQTIQSMHENQMAMNRHYNNTIENMLNNQTKIQLSTNQLYSIMLENSTRLLERSYDDQVNQRTIFLCLTVVIAYFAYLIGVLQTENSWLRTMLQSTSTLQVPQQRQFLSHQSDRDVLRWLQSAFQWIPTWHTTWRATLQVAEFVGFWGIRALGCFFASVQVRILEQAYTGVLDWPGWDTLSERDNWNTRDTFLTLLCNLARSLVIYVTTADHEDIIFGCLFDVFFVCYQIVHWHTTLKFEKFMVTFFIVLLAIYATVCQLLLVYCFLLGLPWSEKYQKVPLDLVFTSILAVNHPRSLTLYMLFVDAAPGIFVSCCLDCFVLLSLFVMDKFKD
jgi:hypothetical protein